MSSPRWAGREGSVVEMVDLGIVRRATNRWSSQGHNVGLVGENLLEETFTAASETGNAVWQTMLARSLYPPSHPSGVSNERLAKARPERPLLWFNLEAIHVDDENRNEEQ